MPILPKILLIKLVAQPYVVNMCETEREADAIIKWDQKQSPNNKATYYKIPIDFDVHH